MAQSDHDDPLGCCAMSFACGCLIFIAIVFSLGLGTLALWLLRVMGVR